MKRSRRDLSIDTAIQRGILKNNQIKLLPYLKQGLDFYCVDNKPDGDKDEAQT